MHGPHSAHLQSIESKFKGRGPFPDVTIWFPSPSFGSWGTSVSRAVWASATAPWPIIIEKPCKVRIHTRLISNLMTKRTRYYIIWISSKMMSEIRSKRNFWNHMWDFWDNLVYPLRHWRMDGPTYSLWVKSSKDYFLVPQTSLLSIREKKIMQGFKSANLIIFQFCIPK